MLFTYKNSMRVLLFLLTTFLLFSCNSTSQSENKTVQKPAHVLIFMDKTASVDVTKDFVYQKYSSIIKDAIEKYIRKEGDILDIYYIHENTAKGKSLSLVSRTAREDTYGMNSTDLEAAQTNYEFSLKKEHNVFVRQALAKLKQKNGGNSNAETNISASLPILNDAAMSGATVQVYFLSDMVESLKNGRDFHVNPPASSEEAQRWAEDDLNRFADFNLNGVNVMFVLPFEPTSSSKENNPNVTTYWQLLFEGLGATTEEI